MSPIAALEIPRLYPILDAESLARAGIPLDTAARALRDEGIDWMQYRNKRGTDADVVASMRQLRDIFPAGNSILLLNDRVLLCEAAGADGVHVGQEDLNVTEARRQIGRHRILGVSTHNGAQLTAAAASAAADYLAIGPVFATQSKADPEPVVGLQGVRAARRRTQLPLVAIGGITTATARDVIEAGADAVAVISSLLPEQGREMREAVRDFLEFLR